MNTTPVSDMAMTRLKLFFALSRTPHGLIDVATPPLAALLALGAFPPLRVIALGLVTAFAGYTAVYALNDLIDYPVDKKKMQEGGFQKSGDYLDAILTRHPLAQGLLSFKAGILWVLGWSMVTLMGAYLLNPVCVVIFVGACLFEVAYCLMWRTSPLRTVVSGMVKTSGSLAAVFAVDPDPGYTFLVLLFCWLFFWEVGGQNIPADWTDMEEDRRLQATTVPVRLGLEWAGVIILASVTMAILLNGVLLVFVPQDFGFFMALASAAIGAYLLFVPACRLHKSKEREDATALFNKASYYPLALLVLTIFRLAL